MATIAITNDDTTSPLEVVERVASSNDWPFERTGEHEVSIGAAGHWTNYHISFTWMSDLEALHLACAFDMRVPAPRLNEVQTLIALINEHMWIGHFDLWTGNGMIMYRHALVLTGGIAASESQCAALLGSALESCERFYPALQFVIWAGRSAREAMASTMFETCGEA